MSADGVADFISTVELHFPKPKFDDDKVMQGGWMASMTRVLGGYDDDILAEAAETIIDKRDPKKDGRFFPLPAECSRICNDVAERRESRKLALLPKADKANDWSDDRLALAFDLVNGEMGRRAARDGWVSSLYHFARKNMRLPQPNEIAAIIAERRELEQFIAGLQSKHRPTSVDAALISFAGQVDKRRDELVDGVVNGVVENKSWFMKG